MPFSAEKFANEYNISVELAKSLQDFTALLDVPEKVVGEEKPGLQSLLKRSINNTALNNLVRQLGGVSYEETGVKSIALIAIMNISYRTRKYLISQNDLNKIFTSFDSTIKGNGIPDNLTDDQKITLKQYSLLYDMAFLAKDLDVMYQKGLIKGDIELEKLYEDSKKAEKIVQELDKSFNKTFSFPTGSFVFDHIEKRQQVLGKKADFISQLSRVITPYGHASKGISVEVKSTGKPTETLEIISHINPIYKEDKFSLRDFLYSDVYVLQIDKLISTQHQTELQKKLGENWKTEINSLYQRIERELHDQAQYPSLGSDASKSKLARTAMASMRYHGHSKFSEKSDVQKNIHDDIFERAKWNKTERPEHAKMLCSEFVGRTTIAALKELNTQLNQRLGNTTEVELIHIPIDPHEKLSKLHPKRLLDILLLSGALTKLEAPEEIQKAMKI